MCGNAHEPSVRPGQAHRFYDGTVARIGMHEIIVRIVLHEHQLRRALLVTLFQIAEGLFLALELRIRKRENHWCDVFFGSSLLEPRQVGESSLG